MDRTFKAGRRLHAWARPVRQRIGRRGAALLAFAFIDYVVAWGFWDADGQAQVRALPSYRALLAVLPVQVWSWVWLGVAVICTAQAFARLHDEVAFIAAIAIKLVWALGMLLGWLVYDAARAWLQAALWGVLAALVSVIAGWPEPRHTDRGD